LKSLLIVAGPTASGKTAVCLEIAKKLPVEMISFDSMQVYKGLPIVTQAPVLAEKKKLRAHLVSFLETSRTFGAARFRDEATSLIEKIGGRGRTPLLSGGTGLYIRSLLSGLFNHEDAPATDLKLRKKLLDAQEKHGGLYLHEKLHLLDPSSAAKIHPNDHRRLVRALEVFELSGEPLSVQKTRRSGLREKFHCPIFFLERDRQDLYARIERRVDVMVKQGLVQEVKRALKKRLGLTASGALGIKEIKTFLEGRSALEEAVQLLKQHTRNYAKRQLSWFRHEEGVVRVPVAADEKPRKIAQTILKLWEGSQ